MCHHIIIYIITLQRQCIEIKFIVLYSEGEKNHKKGGWIVFSKTSFFTFWKTVPRFRVWNSSESDLSSES